MVESNLMCKSFSSFLRKDRVLSHLKKVGFVLAALTLMSTPARAGFFTMPHFVPQGQYSLGLEPELVFTRGGSFGTNFRYTHGLNESSNLTAVFGTGSGSKGIRGGAAMTFDVFPDVGKQPGVGFGGQSFLIQRDTSLEFDVMGFAYVHKNFEVSADLIKGVEPFLAIPLGLEIMGGSSRLISSIGIGTIFVHNPHIRSVLEVTLGINGYDTVFSGGIAYYP